MRIKFLKIAADLSALFLLFSIFMAIGIGTVAAQSVSIDPESTTGFCPGQEFDITIEVDSGTHILQAAHVELIYDSDMFEVIDITDEALFGGTVNIDYFIEPGSGDNSAGKITYGVGKIGTADSTVNGDFISIKFLIKTGTPDGNYNLDLQNVLLQDEAFVNIPDVHLTDGEVVLSCGDDNPPQPRITTPNNGDTINGIISIEEVDDSGENDIVYNLFEYRPDGGSSWTEIHNDTNGNDGWSCNWDTNTVADGDYNIRATMGDTAGQTGTDEITVTVFNEDDCVCDYCLELEAGLSLVSIPRTIDGSNDAQTVFDIDRFIGERCLYYNASAGKYDEVPFDNVEVKPCRGYWVEKNEPYTVCVNFSETGLPSQQLLEGWNMIGNPSLYEIVIFEDGNPADFGSITKIEYPLDNPLYSQINRYNQDTGMENYPLSPNFKHMTPGLGYLILMNEDVMMYGIP